ITIQQAARACGGQFIGDPSLLSAAISGVSIDSRRTQPGDLFVPLKGEQADGHAYILSAFQNGASCALSKRELPEDHQPYIRVGCCQTAFGAIAAWYRSIFNVKVIAVTGSAGKTTTKEMIAAVLSARYGPLQVLKSEKNFNNEIGLPLTLFGLDDRHEIAVLEMGMNHFGEISRLSKIARPDIAVITNIGVSHIEYLGSREGILRAKCEIFDGMADGAVVWLNGDDDLLRTVREPRLRTAYFGLDKELAVYAEDIADRGLDGSSWTAVYDRASFQAELPVPGLHMIRNALAAIGVGLCCGLTGDEMRKGISLYRPEAVENRMNILKINRLTVLNDVYNASPDAMRAALDVLALSTGRKVAVLGDMLELGAQAERFHYEVGQYAARIQTDMLICVGSLARQIAAGAAAAGLTRIYIHSYPDQQTLFSELHGLLKEGDTVLVKASRGMKMEKTVQYICENEIFPKND
ncbi:MAG: UDP-N-acetylmuramoyl-tripeptide--D-alanyl-D-alanine ligase, partial [Oscillospiraceae bacterium]|nr:UDP-N-acetylmuramoyl-tripeptide--D-alanyl-D-alanine ligase [Oscillospiraceae bacterium]